MWPTEARASHLEQKADQVKGSRVNGKSIQRRDIPNIPMYQQVCLQSNRATDSDFLKSEYERFAIDKSWDYFRSLMGKPGRGFLYRVANKLTRGKFNKYMIKRRYDKNSILTVLNYVKCEAHNELIIKGLEEHSETVGK